MTSSGVSRRPKSTGSPGPRTVDQSAAIVTPKVVVLMPPPVPPGEAPMNIRTISSANDGVVIAPMLMVLKPAVRGVTAWKYEASHASPAPSRPSVAGLPRSSRKIATVPPTMSSCGDGEGDLGVRRKRRPPAPQAREL